ncbi:hypothetical protein [Yoonia sp. 2307UL14-13]|uniref:hypothetical protein n=1 Tax=Yoonia sp. 2307UL14-13 TaxID=3126506 RepID=UPI0030EE2826
MAIGVWIYVSDPYLAEVSFFDGEWSETETGYIASTTAQNRGRVCACAAYECEGFVESTTIAQDGPFRRSYQIVRDPGMLPDDPSWGAKVTTTNHCLDVVRDDVVSLHLSSYRPKPEHRPRYALEIRKSQ